MLFDGPKKKCKKTASTINNNNKSILCHILLKTLQIPQYVSFDMKRTIQNHREKDFIKMKSVVS